MAVELPLGWPLVPLLWAHCVQEEVWVAQQDESCVPCPQWIPEPCSAVTCVLPWTWGSADVHHGLVS